MKRILIAAGGTGGHLYPAMGVAEELLRENNVQVHFAAAGLEKNPFFYRDQFSWTSISASSLSLRNPFKIPQNSITLFKGLCQSRRLIKEWKPDLVVGFGSYHSFPVLLAAHLKGVPLALHEQNSYPGKVIRLFSKRALLTGTYFPSAAAYLKGKSILLKMPLRFAKGSCTREEAHAYYGSDSSKKTILLFGGSLGAHFMNSVISRDLTRTFSQTEVQLLHFVGKAASIERIQANYEKAGLKAVVKLMESRMDLAWQAADLAIVRAGAGTIAEQLEFQVPAIYIPYPAAADGHQDLNADFGVDTVGGGWKFQEEDWQSTSFCVMLRQLLENDSFLQEKKQKINVYQQAFQCEEFSWVLHRLLKI